MVNTTPSRVIVITGATSIAGSSLARAILCDPQRLFRVRALTTRPQSAPARALAALGADVVAADLDDFPGLVRAFSGAYGAYCATPYWPNRDPVRMQRQAANLARAARVTGLKHVIWSTHEDVRERVPLSDGRLPTIAGSFKVPHADARGAANRLFVRAGVPTTLLYPALHWESILCGPLHPRVDNDGVLRLWLPLGGAALPGIAGEDVGACSYGIFRSGPALTGTSIGLAAEHLTGSEIAAALGRALGRRVRYAPIAWNALRERGTADAIELANLFQYQAEYEEAFRGMRAPSVARQLNPALLDFAGWLHERAGSGHGLAAEP